MNRPHASPANRYTIVREIASGGMATVYLGRLAGPGGFSRSVAIKRPHPHVARHPEFRAMLLDEGRLAASISHPNVVSTLDVVADGDDLFLVMDYIPGHTLSEAWRGVRARGETIPPPIASAILHGVLQGLSAVHDARDDAGVPLGIVHRDISPQNILVGNDGVARVLDFGVAKAAGRLHETREGQLKGKIAYMAPEQMQGNVSARTDIYAASIVLWEALTGARLFSGNDEVEIFSKALTLVVVPPSKHARHSPSHTFDPRLWSELDALVLRGLSRAPSDRFATAKEMASELARCVEPAIPAEVSAWLVRTLAGSAGEVDRSTGTPLNDTTVAESAGGPKKATLTDSGQGVGPLHVRTGVPEGPSQEVGSSTDFSVLFEPQTKTEVPDSSVAPAVPTSLRRGPGRRAMAVALLVAVGSVGALALATHGSRVGAPVSARVATGTSDPHPSDLPTATATATAPASAKVEPVTPADAGSEPSNLAPHLHDRPAPKNRVEHPRRPPVASQPIDVSHAIDARH